MAQIESKHIAHRLHGAEKEPAVTKGPTLQDILDSLEKLQAKMMEGFAQINQRFTALETQLSTLDHTRAQAHYTMMKNSQLRRENQETPADMERAEIADMSTRLYALNVEDKTYKSML